MKYIGENAFKKWTSLVKSDIKKKLDKNQGTANSGKILGVDASGEVAPTDTEVATLVDVPNGIVKGDGNTLSAAVAGTDYMAPPTGGTAGQVLTKTTDGQEWTDLENVFIIPGTKSREGIVLDKTFLEIKEAYNAGKVCFLVVDNFTILHLIAITDEMAMFSASATTNVGLVSVLTVTVNNENNATITSTSCQNKITTYGLLKGNGNDINNISAAIPGTDYMVPPTGGTAGQVLTKTADGQEWQDREKDLFVVTISGDDSSGYTADKTFAEIKAAYDGGKTVVATTVVNNSMICPLFLVYLADTLVQFTAALFDDASATLSITMDKNNNIARNLTHNQDMITASGLLKGDGIGGVSAAVAGTDYVTPDGMNGALAETKPFIITLNEDDTTSKTVTEIKAAHDAGRACFIFADAYMPLISVNNRTALFSLSIIDPLIGGTIISIEVKNGNNTTITSVPCQNIITASGLLKGDGNGGVSAAVAGTDYVTPSDMTSAIQSAIQNTWEASY